jgi:hypothetical protein
MLLAMTRFHCPMVSSKTSLYLLDGQDCILDF